MKKLFSITAIAILMTSNVYASGTSSHDHDDETEVSMTDDNTVAAEEVSYTKGVVTKVDLKKKKVTIRHEALENLGMEAMKMVFRVADDEMLEKLKKDQEIEFVADRVKGKLTVVNLK